MAFEGSEKKFEIYFTDQVPSLFTHSREFWEKVVRACQAQILSEIKNERVHAFLLSESSLFVFEKKIVMITCGQTKLIESLLMILDQVGSLHAEYMSYERKNEFFPELQYSNFEDDIKKIQPFFPDGKMQLFGNSDGQFVQLYTSAKACFHEPDDYTLEILMHQLGENVRETPEEMKKRLKLDDLFTGFIVDDHIFHPHGYSLNAIKDQFYYTIHVTPESDCSYMSFETNYDFKEHTNQAIQKIVSVFHPHDFATLEFRSNTTSEFKLSQDYLMKSYENEERSLQKMLCGYRVEFNGYRKKDNKQ